MIKQAVVQPKRFGGSSRVTFANPQVFTWSERLQQLSDGLLLAVLFVAPLFMGGRHPLGRVIYVALICLACCTWLLAQLQQPENARRWSPLGALWLAVAALGLVFLQLVPLPAAVVQFLAPGSTEILPYWSTSGDRDTWSTLSMSPAYGRSGLAMGTGFVLLACLIYQRINSAADARWLLKWIAISTVWFAVLGMLQYLFGNGKFMWVYEHPARDTALVVRGPFQNQNHFGQLMALGLGPLCYWLVKFYHENQGPLSSHLRRPQQDSKRHAFSRAMTQRTSGEHLKWMLVVAAMAIVFLAGLLTFSRGAMTALVLALLCALPAYVLMGQIPKTAIVLGAATMVGIGILCVSTHASLWNAKVERSLSIASLAALSPERIELWAADWKAHQLFPWLGSGIGSHRSVYAAFMESSGGHQNYAYAESSYIHLLLETGWCGISLLVMAIGWTTVSVVRSLRQAEPRLVAILVACCAGLVASVFHAVGDFIWQIPACLCPLIILLMIVWRLPAMGSDVARTNPRPLMDAAFSPHFGALLVVVALTPCVVKTLLPAMKASRYWDNFAKLDVSNETGEGPTGNSASNPLYGQQVEKLARQKIMALRDAIKLNPMDGRVHEQLMLSYMEVLQNQVGPLPSLVLEALGTPQENHQAWLKERIGRKLPLFKEIQRHADRTIALTPFAGRAYILKAQVRLILLGQIDETYHALLNQADLVRHYDPVVELFLGLNSLYGGDMPKALERWSLALNYDRTGSCQIAHVISQAIPAEIIVSQMQLQTHALIHLCDRYRLKQDRESLRQIVVIAGQSIESELQQSASSEKNFDRYSQLIWLYSDVQDWEAVYRVSKTATRAYPSSFPLRLAFAKAADACGDHTQALQQIRWCLGRQPENEELRTLEQTYYRKSREASVANSSTAAASEGKR